VLIAVFNQKGGVGKTTTALNLAAAAARAGRAMTLIDMDPQAHLTSIRGLTPDRGRDSMFGFYQDDRTLESLAIEWPGIGHLLPAHGELIKVDSIFGKGPAILGKLHRGLEIYLSERSDEIVIIDCCPFLGVLALNAVFCADQVIAPVSTDFLALRGAQQLERTLNALNGVLKRRVPRRYVLTRFDARRRISHEIHAQLHELFTEDACDVVIRESVELTESPSLGKDVFTHAPKGRGADDYQRLYQSIFEPSDD
jgi:chromosome partitioning protein